MRKTIVSLETGAAAALAGVIDVAELARVEVTSEDPRFPVENLFTGTSDNGWRAERAGEQTLRLIFDEPVQVKKILLVFEEEHATRTQEFVVRWKQSAGEWREIVRQQWNFSPSGSTQETESWQVSLNNLQQLELTIKPDIGGGPAAIASLRRWSLS